MKRSILTRSIALLTLLLVLPGIAHGAERLGPSGLRGGVLLTGNPQPTSEQASKFAELSGGEKASLLIVQIGESGEEQQAKTAWFESPRPVVVSLATLRNREMADYPSVSKQIAAASGVWLHSSLPIEKAAELLRDTAALSALKAARDNGALLGAGGELAAMFGQTLQLWPAAHIECPANVDALAEAYHAQHAQSPGLLGVRIPGGSALLARGRTLRAIGDGAVALDLAAGAGRPARTVMLSRRDEADYNELVRAAVGRSLPAYPPAEVATPSVPSGALVIVGGGGMPREIVDRFVKLGGGAEGKFVVLPTAMPDPLPPDSGAGFLKRAGAKDVTVLTSREQVDLEQPENLELLQNATAIWFGGGRQWRFMDAYAGTKVEPLLHDVLKRGGVIGGSSAGATIQGDYLVRGAPAGPQIMMCEGYERGLGFLPGVAIDQHFTQRKRQPDMTQLMKAYPQYLGIGLDEATAIIVQGSQAEVLGQGSAHFYDRRLPVVEGEPDYIKLPAGSAYDLAERKITKQPEEKQAAQTAPTTP